MAPSYDCLYLLVFLDYISLICIAANNTLCNVAKYIRQLHFVIQRNTFAIQTNTFCNLDKYIEYIRQIHIYLHVKVKLQIYTSGCAVLALSHHQSEVHTHQRSEPASPSIFSRINAMSSFLFLQLGFIFFFERSSRNYII